jgi:hypothetical protein
MPAGDGTGPRSMGPMGGKAAGCRVEQQDGRPGYDSGMGRGYGRGRGKRFRGGTTGICDAAPTATREQELETLKRQAEYFKTAGEEISARIKELETPAGGN